MTEENRRYNIALELAEAEDRLTNARMVLDRGSCKTAAGLAYYAAFHCARALLLMDGVEARTHGGVVHLINLNFVRSGRLSPELGKALGDLQRDRERAEYDAASVLTEEMARESLRLATDFNQAALELLRSAGYA